MADRGAREGTKSYTLKELADLLGARLKGDPTLEITGVAGIEESGPGELSFVTNSRYASLLHQCRASALIVPDSLKDLEVSLLICESPYLTFARAAQLFSEPPALAPGIHPKAHVEESAELGADVRIGPLAHVGDGSRIGSGSRLYGGAYIGSHVEVGEACLIYPGVTILDRCRIGDRVTIHSGTVVGSDGFGYAQDPQGCHVKIPQTGIVQIDEDVEIGANCTIDRATFGRTWIQRGAKVDNLVQIAHNVVIGEHSMLIAQVGISGSTRLGRHVVLAGQVGVAGHLEIGDGARAAARAGIAHSIKAGQDVIGTPAAPHKEWIRMYGNMQRLSRFREELRELKDRVRSLEQALDGE